MTIEEIRNSEHAYAGHIANILAYYKITDEEVIQRTYDWWTTEGFRAYVRIKAENERKNNFVNRDEVFEESGHLAKEKIIEFGGLAGKA